jgi:hypothetical protein
MGSAHASQLLAYTGHRGADLRLVIRVRCYLTKYHIVSGHIHNDRYDGMWLGWSLGNLYPIGQVPLAFKLWEQSSKGGRPVDNSDTYYKLLW